MEHATLMLATSQLGITICSLLILNVSEPAIHHLLAEPLGLTGWSEGVVDVVAFVVALLLVSYLHVVFGEMVPKNLAFSVPDRAVLMLATPLVWVSKLFHPIIVALNWIANHVVRLFRVEPKDEAASTFTLEEVATIVNQSRIEGVLDDTAGTVSAARASSPTRRPPTSRCRCRRLVTLPETTTPDEIERAVAKHGFSRYVIVDDAGVPVGYVHLKDILRAAEGPDAATDGRRARSRPSASTTWCRCSRRPISRTRSRSCAAPGVTSRRCATTPERPRRCCSSRTSSRSSSARCRTRPRRSSEPTRADARLGPRLRRSSGGSVRTSAAGADVLLRPVVDVGAELARRRAARSAGRAATRGRP